MLLCVKVCHQEFLMSLDITRFFKSKADILSNNSDEGHESSKKQLKGSLNDSSFSDNTEVTDSLSKSTGETISIHHIDQAHRLPGKTPNNISNPATVQFLCYNTRNLTCKNRVCWDVLGCSE